MASTINAVSGTGVKTTSDGSGIVKVQSNGVTTNALAWVNFYWTGSVISIKSTYNVSSITRSSTGTYGIAFTNAMADTNYVPVVTCNGSTVSTPTAAGSTLIGAGFQSSTITTSGLTVVNLYGASSNAYDCAQQGVVIFGN